MDIEFVKSKLKVGEIYKNRRELCEHLGETYSNQTNPKKAQNRKWGRCFEYEKIDGSQNIRITKIYDEEKLDFSSKGSAMSQFLLPAILLSLQKIINEFSEKKFFTISNLA